MTANLSLLGVHLCVCVSLLVKDSCRRRPWRCAAGASASPWHSIKDNKMGTEREKDMKARRGWGVGEGVGGDERGLLLQGIWPAWGDRCSCVEGRGERTHAPCCFRYCSPPPPRDEQTDVRRGCSGTLGVSELIQPFSNHILSSPFRSLPSSPPLPRHTSLSRFSSRVALILASNLADSPFSLLSLQLLMFLLLLHCGC